MQRSKGLVTVSLDPAFRYFSRLGNIYGYRAPATSIGWNLDTLGQQLISSLMTLGAFISSGTAGLTASYGTLIGTDIDWATASRPDKPAYLIPLGMVYIVPIIITVFGADVGSEAAEFKATIDNEIELGSDVTVLDMFKNPTDRRRNILAICAVSLQAASGSMFIIAYKAYFLGMSKVANPFDNILSAMGILAIFFNSLIVVRYGRRRVIMMIGQVLVSFTCVCMVSYNRLRSYTFGLAAAVGFLGAWLTTFTAPYFINTDSLNWGQRYGCIWFPSCAIAVLWVFFFLPETKGRTFEEIDVMFEARLPAKEVQKACMCWSYNGAGKERL
ncbi:hypothetical protein VTI74DRAFT_10195 [Chaetomium olivicolor]